MERSLFTRKNKKVTGLMKDELGGKIMTEFVRIRPKAFSHLLDSHIGDKKLKEQKSV